MKLFVSVCVFTLFAQAAQALPAPDKVANAPTQAGPRIIVNPDWTVKPAGEDLANAYPPAAAIAHVSGKAVVLCRVAEAGTLYDCRVVREFPTDWGFGAATLSITPQFRMRPRTVNGAPVAGAVVQIPITWKMKADAPAAPASEAGAPPSPAPAPAGPIQPPASAAKLALALEVQQRTRGPSEAVGLAHVLYDQEIKPLAAGDPGRAKALETSWRASVDKLIADTDARYARAIADVFSDRELEQIVAFLRTDAGAAMIGKLLRARTGAASSARLSLADFVADWRSFYRSKLVCSPEEIINFENAVTQLRTNQPSTP